MSNDITNSIKYITDAAAIFATPVPLGKIVWTNQTAAGDDLLIKDANGVVLFEVKASIQYDYIEFDFEGASHSLTVTTIDTGVLIIHPFQG